jgi:hypothetical protein
MREAIAAISIPTVHLSILDTSSAALPALTGTVSRGKRAGIRAGARPY